MGCVALAGRTVVAVLPKERLGHLRRNWALAEALLPSLPSNIHPAASPTASTPPAAPPSLVRWLDWTSRDPTPSATPSEQAPFPPCASEVDATEVEDDDTTAPWETPWDVLSLCAVAQQAGIPVSTSPDLGGRASDPVPPLGGIRLPTDYPAAEERGRAVLMSRRASLRREELVALRARGIYIGAGCFAAGSLAYGLTRRSPNAAVAAAGSATVLLWAMQRRLEGNVADFGRFLQNVRQVRERATEKK